MLVTVFTDVNNDHALASLHSYDDNGNMSRLYMSMIGQIGYGLLYA
jgi:hypothetical protein